MKRLREKKSGAKDDDELCVVCLDKKRDTVLVECGHYFLCAGCAGGLERCPVCRGVVKGSVKAFG